jgi:hypothetical protein
MNPQIITHNGEDFKCNPDEYLLDEGAWNDNWIDDGNRLLSFKNTLKNFLVYPRGI